MEFDTIVVPTPTGEFNRVFVGQGCWYPLKMAARKAGKVKWTAAYETAPKSAITHIARVRSVKQRADGTYKVVFDGRVKRIRPIPFGGVRGGIRRLRYTTQRKLQSAKSIRDL
ncbi:MAG: hypothetical protein KBA31_14750 [Alphaproteobacteria bacterium]|nr:hypothetical protein [Alphaproteobacteria bacterium]